MIEQLRSPIGPRRDLAQQLILENNDASLVDLSALAKSDASPAARAHALSILDVMDLLEADVLANALRSEHAGLLLVAIPLSESRLDSHPELLESLAKTARHDDLRVVMRTALALGQTDARRAGEILAEIASGDHSDPWLVRAISSSARPHAEIILDRLLPTITRGQRDVPSDLITNLLITIRRGGVDLAAKYGQLFATEDGPLAIQLTLAASFSEALQAEDTRHRAELFRPLYDRAVQQVGDADQNEQTRCEALRLVGIGIAPADQETGLLLDLLHPSCPVSVQQAAIDRLAEFADNQAVVALLEKWPSMTKSVRDHCIGRMLQRQTWTEQLLGALENETIRVTDLSPAVRQQLTHTGSRSMRVRAQRLTRLSSSLEKRELIRSYLAKVEGPANPAQGAQVFQQHCAVCHVANSAGQATGASLENLTDRSHEALLTAILDPNRAVDPKYHSYVIRTADDRLLVGAIEDEVG
ncbi:MAG: c-type cytochrome, partial [Planctomycetes bacterium]|nr:c-type cytochrome [Planctomycetota bacterium]